MPPGQAWHNPVAWHGTHVAGTIVAAGGNNRGVVGAIPSNQNICMRIARIFNDEGDDSNSAIVTQATEWCAQNGARVINLSLGSKSPTATEKALMAELVQNQNILVVAAAGNRGSSAFDYPASYPDVISVAAVDQSLARATFSQFNNQVDFSAPGVGVLSTVPGNTYDFAEGTSMACPHVAGAAAKIWAARPQCTNKQVWEALEKTALDLGSPGRDNSFGHGLVQVKSAYEVRQNCGTMPYFCATPTI
jgi:serine protease